MGDSTGRGNQMYLLSSPVSYSIFWFNQDCKVLHDLITYLVYNYLKGWVR